MLKPICILQLEEHIVRLREELDREREERNYFQLERDKIHTFWEITKRDLDDKKAELRNRDREMEEAEERHQAEIKVKNLLLIIIIIIIIIIIFSLLAWLHERRYRKARLFMSATGSLVADKLNVGQACPAAPAAGEGLIGGGACCSVCFHLFLLSSSLPLRLS